MPAPVTAAPSNDNGLACRGSGTALGLLIVVAVVLVVTAGTLLIQDARSWPARLLRLFAAVVFLAACFLGARALLDTV